MKTFSEEVIVYNILWRNIKVKQKVNAILGLSKVTLCYPLIIISEGYIVINTDLRALESVSAMLPNWSFLWKLALKSHTANN